MILCIGESCRTAIAASLRSISYRLETSAPMVQLAMESNRIVQLVCCVSSAAILSCDKPRRKANRHQSRPCDSGGSNIPQSFSFTGAGSSFTFNAHPHWILQIKSGLSKEKFYVITIINDFIENRTEKNQLNQTFLLVSDLVTKSDVQDGLALQHGGCDDMCVVFMDIVVVRS